HADRVALSVAPLLRNIVAVLGPISGAADWIVRRILKLFRVKAPEGAAVAQEEIRGAIELYSKEVEGTRGERQMLGGILDLAHVDVSEIMVHRIDIVGVPTTASVAEAVKRGLDAGHSRIPVYEGTVDQIVGIFYLKDALRLRRIEDTRSVGEMMRPAYFVPETKKVDDILREMQFRRIHLATIVDEYGGTAGLITIEDILEEIVGDIRDEFDIEEPPVQRLSEDIAVVDASVALDDLNEILGLELASDDVDTLGGLIYESLGRVPSVGDVISTPSARLVVEEVDGTRINKVRVVKSVPGSAPTAAPVATDPSTIRPPTGD
ncbi:MAG: HlyC/CorC family transporter, partial [Proteobacteria bacterium]|nr:HlyC/CorC family transporter [Pseudomonadota bacterium]